MQRDAFASLDAMGASASWTLIIPFAAGVSEMAGQSIVLSRRRIHGVRTIVCFVLTGAVYVAAVVTWTAAAWALLEFDGVRSPETTVLSAIALGYAPRALSFLTIAPYYGSIAGRALDAWSMACVGWGLSVISGGATPVVLLCAALGWAASVVMRWIAGVVFAPALRRLGVATAGVHA